MSLQSEVRVNFMGSIKYIYCALVLTILVSSCTRKTDIIVTGEEPPHSIFQEKCSKCHDLERAYKLERDEDAWEKLVVAMREKTGSDITDQQAKLIVSYHVNRQNKARELFEKECKNCHERMSLMSPPLAVKTPEEWMRTVKRMMSKKGEVPEDETINTLVYYHIRAHTLITSERLERESQILEGFSSGLFAQKCSTCHSLEKALGTIKDKESWRRTIFAMAKKADGRITRDEVVELVNFHMERQDKERDLFLRNCTKCHGEDVPLGSPVMTYEQWSETAVSMIKKAGKSITKEKLDILAGYHSRYEKTMRSLSEKKCTRCHDSERISTKTGTQEAWQRIIVVMSEKEDSGITHADVKRLVRYHVGRQKIEQEIFTKNCGKCHEPDETVKMKKSRDEWRKTIRQMMTKTDKMISDEEVEILMSFHIRRFR